MFYQIIIGNTVKLIGSYVYEYKFHQKTIGMQSRLSGMRQNSGTFENDFNFLPCSFYVLPMFKVFGITILNSDVSKVKF